MRNIGAMKEQIVRIMNYIQIKQGKKELGELTYF